MNPQYKHPKYHVAVDCVIFGYHEGELKLLLYPRGFEPAMGRWSLLGGFVQENESADMAARRVLKKTTGLSDIYLEQVQSFSDPSRDEATRVISLAYYALIRIDKYDTDLVRENGAHWWPISKLPTMIFDHENMVHEALDRLQKKASFDLIGEELLSEMFTLLQLRNLYQAIFQREFDPGNFRKKVLSLGRLEKLNIKNTTESKKGAFYYRAIKGDIEKTFDRVVKF
ncbi:NUDIX domain-containing protein [Labilibaculum sp. A4]|uniref:NUDIX domain-containing protein n=1 Tax=Labilibaculum euxinus TaxID=2686357 RepID=A0A425YD84_9BACT|nr:NUDIX domain-containing protein [Labilibaculum euxinus]MDQ1770674.1 NUDIX domain-containing protein [Labilibaculum euxinus]MUP37224.1 NUDIX domain-containing protein [Labilibaculum euxinus]MVB06429.1 NUDIX domain-containing protein [Labilibaculum euxinus]MWN75845.1 NUDIX domain-containing protein [Labilibaculum euxinus]